MEKRHFILSAPTSQKIQSNWFGSLLSTINKMLYSPNYNMLSKIGNKSNNPQDFTTLANNSRHSSKLLARRSIFATPRNKVNNMTKLPLNLSLPNPKKLLNNYTHRLEPNPMDIWIELYSIFVM
jgi:hypothetical protein